LCDDGNTIDDLTCAADCQSYCGDGIVNGAIGEECDYPDMAGANCTTLGFSSGVLICDSGCAYDTSNCSTNCTDGDGHGYGVGAGCLGPDCNDADAACNVGACCPAGNGMVGEACGDVSQCTDITDGTAECLTNIFGVITFPGGYCTGSSCTVGNSCDSGTGICVDIMGFASYCLKPCTDVSECRGAEGYVCQAAASQPQPGDPTYCIPPFGGP